MSSLSVLEREHITTLLDECAAEYGEALLQKRRSELLCELRQRQLSLLQEYADKLRALEEDRQRVPDL
jgi:hypothetical protein